MYLRILAMQNAPTISNISTNVTYYTHCPDKIKPYCRNNAKCIYKPIVGDSGNIDIEFYYCRCTTGYHGQRCQWMQAAYSTWIDYFHKKTSSEIIGFCFLFFLILSTIAAVVYYLYKKRNFRTNSKAFKPNSSTEMWIDAKKLKKSISNRLSSKNTQEKLVRKSKSTESVEEITHTAVKLPEIFIFQEIESKITNDSNDPKGVKWCAQRLEVNCDRFYRAWDYSSQSWNILVI